MRKIFLIIFICVSKPILAQNVGVGTTSPADKLHINSAVGQNPLLVQVNGATKLRVNSNGGLSVGTATVPAPNGLIVAGEIEPQSAIRSATNPIKIESSADSVEIVAGGNKIIIFASGGIKIITTGTGNGITIDAGSENLLLKGKNVDIQSSQTLTVQSGSNTNISATSALTMQASTNMNISATGTNNVSGSTLRLNGGSTPVGKLGSTVTVNTVTGLGSVTGNASPTVFVN